MQDTSCETRKGLTSFIHENNKTSLSLQTTAVVTENSAMELQAASQLFLTTAKLLMKAAESTTLINLRFPLIEGNLFMERCKERCL
jgi:hypothetical protein